MARKVRPTYDRIIEPLKVRKARQAIEGPQAMREYTQAGGAALERMVQLRAERLQRESQTEEKS
jgi:hypothetical protein